MAIERSEKWVNFINKYRSLRELWDVKCEGYKDIKLRAQAYEKLTQVYKTIDKHATVETVKKRIKNMRTAYLRELKKKLASEINAHEFYEPYEPNLWYFYDFDFLKDVEILADCVAAGASTIASATAANNIGGVGGTYVSNVTTFPSTEEEEDPLLKQVSFLYLKRILKSFS